MYLQANPSKGKGEPEKEEIRKRYTPGESVLPTVKRQKERDDEAEDRRMIEEVREMSLRDVGLRGSGSYERGVRHRVRSRGADGEVARPPTATDAASRARQIEHQSSLRSLLSSSDVDSSEMEEEILRQIMDEGILDGIDLNNIDVSQEDELSEKIADAYRRRHGQRSRATNAHAGRSASSISRERRSEQQRQSRRPSRSPNASTDAQQSSHPPLSRPHLLEAYPTSHGHRRRTSSETRRQTSPLPPSSDRRASTETQRQAARSATDLTNGSTVSSGRRAHPKDLSNSGRRRTDPQSLQPRRQSQSNVLQVPRSPGSQPRDVSSTRGSQVSADESVSSSRHLEPEGLPSSPRITGPSSAQDQAQTSTNIINSPSLYLEPSISCDRCGNRNIEYDLHWNCSECHNGNYNLCLRCYRTSRGCLHWFGFGHAAMQQYRKQIPPADSPPQQSLPHRLVGHRYLHPPTESIQPMIPDSGSRSTSDPRERLLSGPFCSNCLNFTPTCYWRCDVCNTGEWGFCTDCVNQGRCCTHALLPLTYQNRPVSPESQSQSPQHPLPQSNGSRPRSSALPSAAKTAPAKIYTALTISTKCAICTYPIPPSTTRLHCPQCNSGDYDIDFNCYHRLVYDGKISNEDGPKGWRRCQNGHSMVVIGFQDSNTGQRRIIVEDLVGGRALKDDVNAGSSGEWSWREGQQRQAKKLSRAATGQSTESPANDGIPAMLKKYPPNGGVGMHVQAVWSWWPEEAAKDELAFPKGAEIRECEDINGDWFSGIYCARKGVFPSHYCRVIETVGMA